MRAMNWAPAVFDWREREQERAGEREEREREQSIKWMKRAPYKPRALHIARGVRARLEKSARQHPCDPEPQELKHQKRKLQEKERAMQNTIAKAE